MPDQSVIDILVAEVLASAKYRAVSPTLVRDLATRELSAGRSRKEVVKAVKNKLHQVAGAYFESKPDYEGWLAELAVAGPETENQKPTITDRGAGVGPRSVVAGRPAFAAACRTIMARHASTRERLPFIERFYAEVLAGVPPPGVVLDLACGLNPLALPWMPLPPDVEYLACDLYADLAEFLNGFFALAGVRGRAEVCDLVRGAPPLDADLALALKLLPVLEQVDRAAPLRLLQGIRAPRVLVSFPAQSLGGRGKGMAQSYERRFRELVAGQGWHIALFTFPTELAFLVTKPAG